MHNEQSFPGPSISLLEQSIVPAARHRSHARGQEETEGLGSLNESFTTVITRVFFSNPKPRALTELVTPV